MKFVFGDIVVVDKDQIGVICKSWIRTDDSHYYEVYVRSYNRIIEYDEEDIERYMVRPKYLSEEELIYQDNAIRGL